VLNSDSACAVPFGGGRSTLKNLLVHEHAGDPGDQDEEHQMHHRSVYGESQREGSHESSFVEWEDWSGVEYPQGLFNGLQALFSPIKP
jgi:hypothetical protein